MEAVLFGLVVAAGAGAVTWWVMRSRGDRTASPVAEAAGTLHALERDSTVVLDLDPEDVEDERVQRLVRAAAVPVFEQAPRVQVVTVKNRSGLVLGRVPRNAPPMRHVPEVRAPSGEGPRGHTPSPVSHEAPARRQIDPDDVSSEPVHRDLAETFDLPDAVLAHVTDPRDPLDLVDAVLTAAGHATERSSDLVRTGDHVFIVVDGHGRAILGDTLSRAYLKFSETRAKHGYVVVMGFADRSDLDRREALAPQVAYVGRDAIQRMADAVAVGADPLSFVRPPQVEVIRD
ncbi:MAG TPA: hypothetical protein VGA69_02495 [Nitriliruptorales bacterium]